MHAQSYSHSLTACQFVVCCVCSVLCHVCVSHGVQMCSDVSGKHGMSNLVACLSRGGDACMHTDVEETEELRRADICLGRVAPSGKL